jgi:2-C-methyl-D-erythritol 2,4-cyclodiphosphate synthase
VSSLRLLDDVAGLLGKKGYRVLNLDTVIIAQAPRLSAHLGNMSATIANVLKVEHGIVNVKAKSGEGLGAIGREEAIAAQAICLIERV